MGKSPPHSPSLTHTHSAFQASRVNPHTPTLLNQPPSQPPSATHDNPFPVPIYNLQTTHPQTQPQHHANPPPLHSQFDPWRTSGVSSTFRPGGPLASRPGAPVHIIPGGIHCSDLILSNGEVNAGVKAVIEAEVRQIKDWVGEYYAKKRR